MKIMLIGYGKMGKAIEKEAIKKGHEVLVKISKNDSLGQISSHAPQVDVAIEFSTPDSAFDNISTCIQAGLPVISGTTGWLDKMELVRTNCKEKKGAFLYASNFSIGVNLFFKLNKMLTKLMATQLQYQPSMEEIHHTQKLDAPSGTAITLANGLLENQDQKKSWSLSPTAPDQLAITAKRVDKVPGTHAISWDSEVDSIEIKHTAHSRQGFVLGALLAAEWIIGKEGCFGMEDVL